MIRYNRIPSSFLLKLLGEGALNFLTEVLICKNRVKLDVQFREKDTISIYCGSTEIADIRVRSNYIDISAAHAYSKQSCAKGVIKRWKTGEYSAQSLKDAILKYFDRVEVNSRYWSKEGYTQVKWEQRCGRNWNPEMPFMVFDREVVLGYNSDVQKKELQEKFISSVDLARKSIENIPDKKWAKCKNRNSNELDLIALGNDGKSIVLIEVKHHSAISGEIYYSPLQILYYVLEWENALKSQDAGDLIRGINNLVKAKKRLRLLPIDAPELKDGIKPDLKPIIAVDEAGWSKEVNYRLREVIKTTNSVTHNALGKLQIWEYPKDQEPLEYHLDI